MTREEQLAKIDEAVRKYHGFLIFHKEMEKHYKAMQNGCLSCIGDLEVRRAAIVSEPLKWGEGIPLSVMTRFMGEPLPSQRLAMATKTQHQSDPGITDDRRTGEDLIARINELTLDQSGTSGHGWRWLLLACRDEICRLKFFIKEWR